MRKLFLFGALALACAVQAKTVTLNVAQPLNPAAVNYDSLDVWAETYNEDDYETIDYQSMSFSHAAMTDWNFWYGFTIAKCQDTTYAQMTDQFRCVAGGGMAGKGTPYLLAYAAEGMSAEPPCQVFFDAAYTPKEVSLCIGSWALHNVTVGGAGHTFAAGDSLVIEIQGLDENEDVIEGKKVTFFLADYRSENQADWHLNNSWETCDLSELGEVYGLCFTMKTSDVGDWGSNTALYFALDGLKISQPEVVAGFEDITIAKADTCWQGADEPILGWNNWKSGTYGFQTYNGSSDWGAYFSAFTVSNQTDSTYTGLQDAYRSANGGAYAGQNFAVWNLNYYGADTITFAAQTVPGMFVNNTAYAVASMCNGDDFAKKFTKDDWFKLTIHGYLNGEAVNNEVVVELAADGKYINQWTFVDLTELGEIDAITFSMSSSDSGDYGMNTPAYFALDNFGSEMPMGYMVPEMAEFDLSEGVENVNATAKPVKVLRNGMIIIVRDGAEYTVTGQCIK